MSTTTTKDPTPATLPRPRRVSTLQDLSPALLIPEIDGTPKPVREAAAAARSAWEAYEREAIAYRLAEEEASEAPAVDERADAQALERGDDLPEPTAPEKRKAHAQANRRKLAAAENLRAAIYKQAEAMRECYGEWVADVEQRTEARIGTVRELVDKLRQEFAALGVDRELQRALAGFDGNPANWHFQLPRPDRQQRRQERVDRDLAKRAGLRPNAPVEREPVALTAALLMLAERDS